MNNFKASNGKYYTRALFWEESIDLSNDARVIPPVFTLYKDKPNLINFGKAYVETRDPTGYKVTQELLNGDYNLWTVLMNCTWFLAAKEMWDRELDAALSSEGMEKIRVMLTDGLPAQQLAAAKYLANKEYRKDKTATKGRPSSEQVTRQAREQAAIEKELAEDFKRIKSVK
jgi:hypothetical protein